MMLECRAFKLMAKEFGLLFVFKGDQKNDADQMTQEHVRQIPTVKEDSHEEQLAHC